MCFDVIVGVSFLFLRFVRELGSGWGVTSASGIHHHQHHPLVHPPATCLVGGLRSFCDL